MSHWTAAAGLPLIAEGLVTCSGMRTSHGQPDPPPLNRKDPRDR